MALVTGGAGADALCPAVEALARHVAARSADAPPVPPGAEDCSLTLALSGGHAVHCSWSFSFRDAAADDRFDRLELCLDGREVLGEDRPVNHPDTHRLRRYRVGGADITLSIKDKSVRGRTYVFIGATAAAD